MSVLQRRQFLIISLLFALAHANRYGGPAKDQRLFGGLSNARISALPRMGQDNMVFRDKALTPEDRRLAVASNEVLPSDHIDDMYSVTVDEYDGLSFAKKDEASKISSLPQQEYQPSTNSLRRLWLENGRKNDAYLNQHRYPLISNRLLKIFFNKNQKRQQNVEPELNKLNLGSYRMCHVDARNCDGK